MKGMEGGGGGLADGGRGGGVVDGELGGDGMGTGLGWVGLGDDVGQKDMGLAGWVRRESTAYISISNILNISLSCCGGPAMAPQSDGPWLLPESCALQLLKSGLPSNLTV